MRRARRSAGLQACRNFLRRGARQLAHSGRRWRCRLVRWHEPTLMFVAGWIWPHCELCGVARGRGWRQDGLPTPLAHVDEDPRVAAIRLDVDRWKRKHEIAA